MAKRGDALSVSIGIASDGGRRRQNEDFAAARIPPRSPHGVIAALADGMGGAKGGRVAAELAVRSLITDFFAVPATVGVQQAIVRVAEPLNAWIHAQGKLDPALEGMGSTLAALVLRGRSAHVFHVGDSRVWRFRNGQIVQLTIDHTLQQAGLEHVLYRAIGIEESIRLDYRREPLALHDRFLVTSDGVHGTLKPAALQALMAAQTSAEATAAEVVAAALTAGSTDNASAIVVDVLGLPAPDRDSLANLLADLPILPPPKPGETIDSFLVGDPIAKGRYSRLFRARDTLAEAEVVLKFPLPAAASADVYRSAYVREAWAAAQVASPHLVRVVEPARGRQSQLYAVMAFHDGETLESRLQRRGPLSLGEVQRILAPVIKATHRLHRNGIIHRDIKPDNIMLDPVTLIDLGVALIKGQDDDLADEAPGTPSYMAPELFAGRPASEASDVFALGVTLYRALTGRYPYGEIEPFSRPDFRTPAGLTRYRPDLPGWIEAVAAKACAVRPEDRYEDAIEFLSALENGPVAARPTPGFVPLIERSPVRFWQGVAALLAIVLVIMLFVFRLRS